MNGYECNSAGWEWRDQEEERWHAENISEQDSSESEKQIMSNMLAQFDSVFGQSKESN